MTAEFRAHAPPAPETGVTRRILPAVSFTFVCYLAVGMLLAILPRFVHLRLGFGETVAGLVVSAQYVATVLSRPQAGRMTDRLGPKRTVIYGLAASALAGAFTFAAGCCAGSRWLALGALLAGRLALGVGESLAATGATMWGIGRVGFQHTARVISWNGISTYGALAVGAPLGVALEHRFGLGVVGLTLAVLCAGAAVPALRVPRVEVARGAPVPFGRILSRVAPMGLGLALGGIGFGVLAAFVTLYYARRGWPGAALSLSVYGVCFMAARFACARTIERFGGFPVAAVSFAVECTGLTLLGLAPGPGAALAGAALTGLGFSLIFPALGVEAVRGIPAESRGAALGAYTAFVDLSLFVSGPAAGAVIAGFGYAAGFLGAAASVAVALGLVLWLGSRRVLTRRARRLPRGSRPGPAR